MDQNQSVSMVTTSSELLLAHAELWQHTFSYFKSMALRCAIKLGIPNAIHRCGGAASLPELLSVLSIPASKQPHLSRLMRLLTVSGIFAEGIPAAAGEGATGWPSVYRLTPVSRLLVDEAGVDGRASQSPIMLLVTTQFYLAAALSLPEWFKGEEEMAVETPFAMAHGAGLWGLTASDAEFNAAVNDGMGCDSRFVMDIVLRECGEVFEGLSSLVDVGGGNGEAARAIAKAFPHVKCSVLDLPQVVNGIPTDGVVEFITGDMMHFIPPANAVLFKAVLQNWTDEDCVKILELCKKAIPSREAGGKVIIIDMVVGSPSKTILENQLLLDLCMMTLTTGKQREEQEWHKIFIDAGFSHYKIRPVLGPRSIIEVYP